MGVRAGEGEQERVREGAPVPRVLLLLVEAGLHLVANLVLQLLAPLRQQLDLRLVLRQQALLVLARLAQLARHLLAVLLRAVELAAQLLPEE